MYITSHKSRQLILPDFRIPWNNTNGSMEITKPNQIFKKKKVLYLSSCKAATLWLDYSSEITWAAWQPKTAESKPLLVQDTTWPPSTSLLFLAHQKAGLISYAMSAFIFCVLISYWGIKFFESLTASLICRSERYDAILHGFQMISHAVWTLCYITEKNMECVKTKSQGNVLVDLNGRMKHLLFIQCV